MRTKELLQNVLGRFGYQIRRSLDGFTSQKGLVRTPSPVIFDVGAHIGSVAKTYRELFPSATIHCFEPDPGLIPELRKSVGEDPGIHLHELALSDQEGKSLFHVNSAPATNSLLATDSRAGAYFDASLYETKQQVEVHTTTVDAFCQARNLPAVDILKLDVQGAEYAVLEGAKGLLAQGKISLIFTEIIMIPTYQGQRKFHDYLGFFDQFGYDLFDIYYPARNRGQLVYADALFFGGQAKRDFSEGASGQEGAAP